MKVVAHRGYSARYPENSVVAFEQAIAAGADYIETDVRLAADGTPVCWHDADFMRVAADSTAIAASPADAIARIALPGGARVHRLEEVLAVARGRTPVLLDVKVDGEAVRAATVRVVSAAAMTEQIVYGVRNARHALALDGYGSELARLAMPAKPEMLGEFPLRRCIGVRLWEDQVNAATVANIRRRNLEVWVTAGVRSRGERPGHIDAARLERLRASGVDAVLVNDVALAVAIVHA
jgi:glycerophosphoryl diester phosphodiesterase